LRNNIIGPLDFIGCNPLLLNNKIDCAEKRIIRHDPEMYRIGSFTVNPPRKNKVSLEAEIL